MLSNDPSFRPCLKFVDEQRQCRRTAAWVCCDVDLMQWFACEEHAGEHDYVRIPLGKFVSLAHSLGHIPQSEWEPSPQAPDAVRQTFEGPRGA